MPWWGWHAVLGTTEEPRVAPPCSCCRAEPDLVAPGPHPALCAAPLPRSLTGSDLPVCLAVTSRCAGLSLPQTLRELTPALPPSPQNGIVHRDLKLENILLDANGNIKVRGWHGLAVLGGHPRGAAQRGGTRGDPQGFPELWHHPGMLFGWEKGSREGWQRAWQIW